MLVLRSRGAELEREFAFGVVRQLFEAPLAQMPANDRDGSPSGAGGHGGGAAVTAGRVLGTAPGWRAGPDPSFAVLHGLYWLCANLAARRPVGLAVDDAHWADSASLRFLAFMLPRLEDLPITLIVATRPRESTADTGLIATLTTDPSAEIVRLGPLTRDGVEEFVAAGLGAEPDPAFVTACCRATRGTPFLLRELVGALREDMVAPSAAAAATVERIGARTVGRSISLRLDRLPEAAERLARALAILERGDLWQAARLAELDERRSGDGRRPARGGRHRGVRASADLRAPDRADRHLRGAHAGPAGSQPPCWRRCSWPGNRGRRSAWPNICSPASPQPTYGWSSTSWRRQTRRPEAALPTPPRCILRRALEEPPDPASRPGPAAGARDGRGERRAAPPGRSTSRRRSQQRHRRLLARGRRDGARARAGSRPQVGRRRRGARSRGVAARPDPRGARGCGSRPRRSGWR